MWRWQILKTVGRFTLAEALPPSAMSLGRIWPRILSDGSVDASWNPSANSSVVGLFESSGILYLGGLFTTVGGQSRARLAAIDAQGNVTSWNPGANGSTQTIVGDSGNLYIGGQFRTVGGLDRDRLAAIDTAGNVLSWDPGANNAVSSLAVLDGNIYVGGVFTTLASTARSRLGVSKY